MDGGVLHGQGARDHAGLVRLKILSWLTFWRKAPKIVPVPPVCSQCKQEAPALRRYSDNSFHCIPCALLPPKAKR